MDMDLDIFGFCIMIAAIFTAFIIADCIKDGRQKDIEMEKIKLQHMIYSQEK